jgi:tRNA-modifying protein YgfZ
MSDGYALMRSEAGLVVDSHQLVWVEGRDAAKFLQGLISQDVAKLTPDRTSRSFLLSPQGKLKALLWVFGSGDRIGIITQSGMGELVADDLAHYKIRIKASIGSPEKVSQVIGPKAERFGGVSAPLPSLPRVFVWDALPDLPRVSPEEWDTVRIEEGEPLMGVDVDERTIPQESGLVDQAVSFTKGCFLGQELVARIDSRGHVNRHLRTVELDSAVAVPAPVELDGEEGGNLTSVTFSPISGRHLGLAMLRKTMQPGAQVSVGGVPATIKS